MALLDPAQRRLLDSLTIPEGDIRVSLHTDADRPSGSAPPHPDPDRFNGTEPERQPEGWVAMNYELPMVGLAALRDLVGRLSYKPGWRLKVDGEWPVAPSLGQFAGARFSVRAPLEDTYNPGQIIQQEASFMAVPWLLERWGDWLAEGSDRGRRLAMADMLRWVRKCLGIFELHERDEWLELDGAKVFDPHEGQAPGALRLHNGSPHLPR
jgi:hypothetical protein